MKHTDLTYLKEIANGSNTFIVEMLSIFIREIPEALIRMETHLQNNDWKSLHGLLHKIKPSISFVGLKEVEKDVRLAEEYCASQNNLHLLPGMIATIKQTCTEAIEELRLELPNYK